MRTNRDSVDTTPDPVPAASVRGGFVPKHKIRLVTATSLFDGHDASIHIFRRIAQASGAEVIHLRCCRDGQAVVSTGEAEEGAGGRGEG